MLNKNKGFIQSSVFCKKRDSGFTLIELLVVIAIIGLLSTLAIVALDSARQKSRDVKRVSEVRQLQTALELYFNDQESYPGTGEGAPKITLGEASALVFCARSDGIVCRDGNDCGFVSAESDCDPGGGEFRTYMGQVPSSPKPPDTNKYEYQGWVELGTCTGAGFISGPCSTYLITFELEGNVNNLEAGPHSASPEGIQ